MAHIEREIKLRLTPQALARLARLAPRRRSVSSVYYDTARQELRRAGVALRLRRDAGRWLQTLKVESAPHAGLAARAEWELPVRRRALQTEAFPREEIRNATGVDLARLASRLRPVFETRFQRRSGVIQVDGKASAELAIDRGRILAGRRREPISEVELELLSGDPRALLRFAESLELPLAYESKAERGYRLAAGLAPAPRNWRMPAFDPAATPGNAFAALIAASLVQAGTNATGMLAGRDPEYLHQLRVGLRRLRSALGAFAPLLEGATPLRQALRRLTPPLGAARDADVLLETLATLDAAPRVVRAARAYRARARRAALDVVASAQFRGLLFDALRWLQSEPWEDSGVMLAAFARQRLERLHRRAVREIDFRRPKRRHKLRIRIKRLRYASEFFAPCFPQPAVEPYAKALRRLQDVLGELNDLAMARRLLRTMELAPPPLLQRREVTLIARLREAWAQFDRVPAYWRPAA